MSLLLLYYCYLNLTSNAVYYAQKIPHVENQSPEKFYLMKNLKDVSNPNPQKYVFDIDEAHSVKNSTETFIIGTTSNGRKPLLIRSNFSHRLDADFHIISSTDRSDWREVQLSKAEINQINKEIDEFLQPLIDSQGPPLINLQWIFNLIHYKEFK